MEGNVPSPREPPVTTTTFPFKEKILGKSWSSVSYLDILSGIEVVEVGEFDFYWGYGKMKKKEAHGDCNLGSTPMEVLLYVGYSTQRRLLLILPRQ